MNQKLKCNTCKRTCRSDGWCNKCGAYTTEAKDPEFRMDIKTDGYQNKIRELARQYRWLKHKLDSTTDLEKKNKAAKQLHEWERKHSYYMKHIREELNK